jgi:hypothetical protein
MRGVQLLAGIASAGLVGASLVMGTPASAMDTVNGTGGSDRLRGTAFSDTIRGFGGNDRVHALAGPDLIFDGAGTDTIFAGPGNDNVFLEDDGTRDTVTCGPGHDVVLGATSENIIAADCEDVHVQGPPAAVGPCRSGYSDLSARRLAASGLVWGSGEGHQPWFAALPDSGTRRCGHGSVVGAVIASTAGTWRPPSPRRAGTRRVGACRVRTWTALLMAGSARSLDSALNHSGWRRV